MCKSLRILCLLGTALIATGGWAASFDDRCGHPAVILCDPLDTEGPYGVGIEASTPHTKGLPFSGKYGDWRWIDAGPKIKHPPELDRETKASGTGSLKFTIPSQSDANDSGYFQTNFTPDNSVQFGEGDTFFVQWRQRLSRAMLFNEDGTRRKYRVTGGAGGFKTIIINAGDHPALNYPVSSCTRQHLVLGNAGQMGSIVGYHSCGWYQRFETYHGLHRGSGSGQHDWQPGGDNQCWRLHPNTGKPLGQAYADCELFWPDEWMTFQVQVTVSKWAKRSNDSARSSNIKLWVAREGKPSRLVIDHNLNLRIPEESFMKYGKVWLLPYHTKKDSTEVHPEAYTWYDELIVSTQRIADPN